MCKGDIKLGKGIWEQMQDAQPIKVKPLTKKDLENFFIQAEEKRKQYLKRLDKLEKEWVKHWTEKRKEFPNEGPPMWLVLKTMSSMNQGTGGIWMTSKEMIDKYKKWLV